jgi:phosphatidylinositol glycan class C protein
MSIAVVWFAILPLILRTVGSSSRLAISLLIMVLAVGLVSMIKLFYGLVFIAVLLVITFILPALQVHMQRYKNQIHGPWDEASLRLRPTNLKKSQ